jgi:hypothetical protein
MPGDLVGSGRDSGGLHLLLIDEGLHDEETLVLGLLNLMLERRYIEPVGLITIRKLEDESHKENHIIWHC